MMCGAKRYIVELEIDGELKWECVTARTPARARRVIRSEYGEDTKIISSTEEKNSKQR